MEASADIWRYLEASRGVRRYEVEGTEGPESEAATELAREAARRWLDEKLLGGISEIQGYRGLQSGEARYLDATAILDSSVPSVDH